MEEALAAIAGADHVLADLELTAILSGHLGDGNLHVDVLGPAAMRAIEAALDPAGIMNPGVVLAR